MRRKASRGTCCAVRNPKICLYKKQWFNFNHVFNCNILDIILCPWQDAGTFQAVICIRVVLPGDALHVNLTVSLLLSLFQAFVSEILDIVHNIFVSSQYCLQPFLFPHNIVHNIFVSSQYCLQHFCFLTILSTTFLFPHDIVHNIFVSSQYCPQHFCFLTILSTTISLLT